MFRCEWCGEDFEKPKWRMTEDRHIQVCPYCGEPEIRDVTDEYKECVCCGKMVRSPENGVCDDCDQELYTIWEEAVDKAMKVTRTDYDAAAKFLKEHIKVFER